MSRNDESPPKSSFRRGADVDTAAWRELCDRLKATGERLLTEEFPDDPHDRAEGYRHLGRLTVYALQWFLEFQDAEFPAFHRYDDDDVRIFVLPSRQL